MNMHIIAEAGSNHNGDIGLAKLLIDAGSRAKCNSVKFQDINPECLYISKYVSYPGNEIKNNPVLQQRNKEYLTRNEIIELYEYGVENTISVTFSVFSQADLDFHASLNPEYIKIASTDNNYIQLLSAAADSGMKTIISTGMASTKCIDSIVNIFDKKCALKQLVLLHCISMYPCDISHAQLLRISDLKKYGCAVGFSDHTQGNLAGCIATALGAEYIEKHFTLDNTMAGFDHKYALDIKELNAYVEQIKDTLCSMEYAGEQRPDGEKITAVRARRGIYATRDIFPGEIIGKDDLMARRPSNDLCPEDMERIYGMTANEKIVKYQGVSIETQGLVPDKNNLWEKSFLHWINEMKDKGM